MKVCRFEAYVEKDSFVIAFMDKMDEWQRRWTVNPLGSARVGSNPIFVVFLIGSMVKWIAFCTLNSAIRVQISEKSWYLENLSDQLL